MNRLAISALIVCFLCGVVIASEEDILPPRKVCLTADGGKAFGEVSATLENGKDYRIKAITLTVRGRNFQVPEEQFSDLRDPLINTAEFRVDGGRGGQPLLYLTFRLAKPGAKSVAEYPRVYIRFENGKLLERYIHDPQ